MRPEPWAAGLPALPSLKIIATVTAPAKSSSLLAKVTAFITASTAAFEAVPLKVTTRMPAEPLVVIVPITVPATEIVDPLEVPETETVPAVSNQNRSVPTAAESRRTVSVAELNVSSLRCVSSTSSRSRLPSASSTTGVPWAAGPTPSV